MKFHGELQLMVKVGIVVEADNLEAAQSLCKDVGVSLDEPDGIQCREWDTEPKAVYLFEGEE